MQHMKLLEISSREHPVCPERDIGTAPGKWGKRGSGDRTPKSLIGKSASNPERKGAGGGARVYVRGKLYGVSKPTFNYSTSKHYSVWKVRLASLGR